jgi:hypothetical protein
VPICQKILPSAGKNYLSVPDLIHGEYPGEGGRRPSSIKTFLFALERDSSALSKVFASGHE